MRITAMDVTSNSTTSRKETVPGIDSKTLVLREQTDKTLAPLTSLSLSQVAKLDCAANGTTLVPFLSDIFRSEQTLGVSAVPSRCSTSSQSPRDSTSANPIRSEPVKKKTRTKTDTPGDIIPSGPLTVKQWTATVGSITTKTTKNKIAENHLDAVGSLEKTSTKLHLKHEPIQQNIKTLAFDQDGYQESLVNEYLDMKYRECVLKSPTTRANVPSFDSTFCRRQEIKQQQQQQHEVTLVAASLLSNDEGTIASNIAEATTFRGPNDSTKREEEIISMLKRGTSPPREDDSNSDIEPTDTHEASNRREESCNMTGKDTDRAMTDMELSPPSPSGSGSSSSLETIEQDISDDYAPIDLTSASSDVLFETLFGLDTPIQINPSTDAVGSTTPFFVFPDETKGQTISRVSPDPSQSHHPYVYQQSFPTASKGIISQDSNHIVPILLEDELLSPSVMWHDSADSLLNSNSLEGQHMFPQFHPMGQSLSSLNSYTAGGTMHPETERKQSSSLVDFDDDIIRSSWDFPHKDHWDFTGSTLLSHNVLTHPYQQHSQCLGYGSIFPSDMGVSYISNDLTPGHSNQVRFVKKGGHKVIPAISMSCDRLVRAKTQTKNAPGKRKRQATSGPKDPTTKKQRMKKVIEVSKTGGADNSTIDKNPALKHTQMRRKIPNRNTNEPHFSPSHKRVWMKHYEDFREYVGVNGHGLIPHDYSKNRMLARWVKRQVRHAS